MEKVIYRTKEGRNENVENTKKDSFILYLEHKNVFDILTDEEAGKLIKAIFEYEEKEELPNLDKSLQIAFIPIKNTLDRNKEKYQKVIERNKENIKKRWNKNNTKNTTGKNGIPNNTKNTDNDNEYDHDNDHENDNDINKKNINKKIHFAEFVSMTNAEYEKLVSTYGKDIADQCITILDNYKGANGKKYKNDYRAILNWVIDKVKQTTIKTNDKNSNQNKNWFAEIGKEEGLF